ncbi:hypothetical protein AAFC00_003944 [Neodothiora populina]|uniref:Nuclear speckle splicing regulatory protein 1 N-terminal domain-containing protein n=1 Tax=Neodothiora populina TaxID=2781224 RepID=A0ABR3PI06_9PEZI
MSLKFGLNVKSKAGAVDEDDAAASKKKRGIAFDDDDDDLDVASDDEQNRSTKGGNVFGEEEELTEFNASVLGSSSRPAQPKPKAKSTATLKSRSGAPPSNPPTRKPKQPLDMGDHNDDDGMMEFGDLSSIRETKAVASKAEELDPTIYDYDAFHSAHSLVHQQKQAAERQDAVDRKPRYIGNLIDAAARRKQDQQIAREKLLQKERENEGDEFADKEKFVTGAYKQQQEETKRLEEAEKKKTAEEEERRRKNGGGMQGFYKNLMGQEDKRHAEALEATKKLERGEIPSSLDADDDKNNRTEAQLAAEMRAKGVNIHINEEGQITDKRQLLSAGLNVAPAGGKTNLHSADHLKASNQKNRESAFQSGSGRYDRNDQRAMRERQTRMLEDQLEQANKRKREEEEEERKKLEEKSKSRKTETDVSSARERYLARKREQEAKKKAAADAS